MAIRIKVLPDDLVNKIAAGEVVERPASVVKELVENALDAGATEVIVDVRSGGRSHIHVIDNGCGMTRDEALLSIERHATSKIVGEEDLHAVQTLGFRGEALAAIAGVSRLEMVTRTRESDAAVRVRVEGGLVRAVDTVDAPPGTSIRVQHLFYNTPARRKFMKGAAVETGHVVDLFTRLAMAHEGVALRLMRGTETLLHVPADARGLDRVRATLGDEVADRLHPFSGTRGVVRVSGFLSAPDLTRSGWSGLYGFVNRRFLRDRVIQRAVARAYQGTVPRGRHPVVVLFLEVPPDEVDVNVHPGKVEVRFANERRVSELIVEAIRSTLRDAPWRRSDSRSGPDWSVSGRPVMDPGGGPPRRHPGPEGLLQEASSGSPGHAEIPPPDEEERARLDSLVSLQPPTILRKPMHHPRAAEAFGPDVGRSGRRTPERPRESGGGPPVAPTPSPEPPETPKSTDTATAGHGAPPLPGMAEHNFSRMHVIGQYANCFILCQDGDDLVIIDQHAAHERVTFEKLRAAREGGTPRSQLLLTPAMVELPAREAVLLADLTDDLARLGLEVEPFGGRTFAVKALPVALQDEDPGQLLQDLALEMSGEIARKPLEDRYEALLATMACHGSIRANRRMTRPEMEALLQQLDGTDYNYACPHGRPLVVRSSRRDIEKLFKRG